MVTNRDPDNPTGVRSMSVSDRRDYTIKRVYNVCNIPEYSIGTPTKIFDQGSSGTCVACSIATCMNLLSNHHTVFSPGYIHAVYSTTGPFNTVEAGLGMSPRSALKLVHKIGTVTYKKFPWIGKVKYLKSRLRENEQELSASDHYCIGNYYRLDNSELEIKSSLYKGNPVLAIVPNTYSLCNPDENNYISSTKMSNRKLVMHSIVITGWNEHGYEIVNSFGKDYGNYGVATLSYRYPIYESWSVTADDNESAHPIYKSSLFVQVVHSIYKRVVKSLKDANSRRISK